MPDQQDPSPGVTINRGKLDCISLYEITGDELDLLERGSPDSTYLNFAIGLISVGISFFVSIFSTEITEIKVYVVFWVVALVTTIAGIVLLVVWRKSSRATKTIIRRIRDRLQPATPSVPELINPPQAEPR